MISATKWLLIVAIYYSDGRQDHQEGMFSSQEVCVSSAIQVWNRFYTNPGQQKDVDTVCVDQENHYKFVRVTCNGVNLCEF